MSAESVETVIGTVSKLLPAATSIDPSTSDVRLLRANLVGFCQWQWDEAKPEYLYAPEVEPNSATARAAYRKHLVRRGELATGFQRFDLAVALDPLSAEIRKFHADAPFLASEREASLRVAEQGVQLHATSWLM
jgi:Tfp pilus assembly protein PilF